MFRFLKRFGRDSHARWRGTGPLTRVGRRNHRLNIEALESRQLLSTGPYYLVNQASGNVLDDPAFSTSNGTAIIQCQVNGGLEHHPVTQAIAAQTALTAVRVAKSRTYLGWWRIKSARIK